MDGDPGRAMHASSASQSPLDGPPTPTLRVWCPFDRGFERSNAWNIDASRPRAVLAVATGGVPRLLHEELRVVIPAAPTHVVNARGRRMLAPEGAIVVTPPTEPYTLHSATDGAWSAKILLLPPTLVTRAAQAARRDGHRPLGDEVRAQPAMSYFSRVVILDRELRDALSSLFDDLWSPVRSADCEQRLTEAVGTLAIRHASPVARAASHGRVGPRRHDAVRRLHAHLVEHVAEPVSLDEMASAACLSKYYLARAFERAYGMPPRTYLMELRLARARSLLAAGVSPSRVTYDAGFADQSHLTRRFKRGTGMTPSCYARQLATAPCGDAHRDAARDAIERAAG
jgi:AraC-like DNA-binding protein